MNPTCNANGDSDVQSNMLMYMLELDRPVLDMILGGDRVEF